MPTQETREFVKDSIEAYLEMEGLQYFRGGSERFGYATEVSDLDFFVHMERRSLHIRSLIETLNLTLAPLRERRERYPAIHLETSAFGIDIDIIVINSRLDFHALKDEHQRVLSFLEEHPNWREFCKTVKAEGMTGRSLYRLLVKRMKGEL